MAYEGWQNGIPPFEWDRILAWDVGGASPHAMVWAAIDPLGFVVAYDEVYIATTDLELLANMALPKMKDPDGRLYNFRYKVVDYENKIAAADLGKRGIIFTNAIKQGKAASIQRFSSYLHPNPKRPFPNWHPLAGQPGAPLFFVMSRCKNLIKEIPQQRWKETVDGSNLKDEQDRNVPNHAVDCCLYLVRPLPHASDIKVVQAPVLSKDMNLISRLYYEDLKKMKERKESNTRRPYSPNHIIGGREWRLPS